MGRIEQGQRQRFFSFLPRADRTWYPPSLLFNQ